MAKSIRNTMYRIELKYEQKKNLLTTRMHSVEYQKVVAKSFYTGDTLLNSLVDSTDSILYSLRILSKYQLLGWFI